jgi:hypothetical protein
MSLLRLLTAGRSLVGLKKSETRYHVTRQRLLPKFAAKRNPFGKSTEKPAETAKSQRCEAADVGPGQPVQNVAPAEPQPKTTGQPAEIIRVPASPSSVPIAPGNAPERQPERNRILSALGERLAGYASGMSRLVIWRRGRPTQREVPRFNKPLVQGELSLDRVKVVRNDLSDTDLEIVRPKPQAVVPNPSAESEKSKPPVAESTATSRMNLGMFSAGKT